MLNFSEEKYPKLDGNIGYKAVYDDISIYVWRNTLIKNKAFQLLYYHKWILIWRSYWSLNLYEAKKRAELWLKQILKTPVLKKIRVEWKNKFKEILNNKVNILWQKIN